MSVNSDQFYNELSASRLALADLLIKPDVFRTVPADWHVIITDIKGSTHAVLNGLHESVNLIATGSIVTVLNLSFKAGITVPFFFGGDGATFIVPPAVMEKVMPALLLYRQSTMDNFGLELRVGTLPVAAIYAQEYQLQISKFRVSDAFFIPVILGNGLNYAEKLIKAEDYLFNLEVGATDELDLSGMQCRWDKIEPPENSHEIVTLLIIAGERVPQYIAFSKAIRYIDDIYGSPQKRQPISVAKLRLNTTFNRLSLEMRAKMGKIRLFELIRTWLTNLYGFIYFSTRKGKDYLDRLVEMSDTLVIDGKINTVISGNSLQRGRLCKVLDTLEAKGEICYGFHVSKDAVMSCYVRDLEDGHIHFVDGSEGGYTQAAAMLKSKLISRL
ncbi:DUF3095 family protein [Pedobacter sp. AW31-3R]|uniref:DUF3095 family protein n=1 Tax=Pedobacter sp. AW31-3R TaxID=3445781 RepID=UPI003FA1427E